MKEERTRTSNIGSTTTQPHPSHVRVAEEVVQIVPKQESPLARSPLDRPVGSGMGIIYLGKECMMEGHNERRNRQMTRVAAYARIGSVSQTSMADREVVDMSVEQGPDSAEMRRLNAQMQQIEELCHANPGYEIAKRYMDVEQPAWNGKAATRPAYLRMMADARDGKFDLVVTVSVDRISRNVRNLIESLETLSKHGVAYRSINDKVDFSGPNGEVLLTMFSFFGEFLISSYFEREQDKSR